MGRRSRRGPLLVTILANRTAVITQQAETLAFIALAPLAFDLGDRRSLDPGAPDRPGLRRLVQREIGDRLARALLSGAIGDGDVVRVDRGPEGLTVTRA